MKTNYHTCKSCGHSFCWHGAYESRSTCEKCGCKIPNVDRIVKYLAYVDAPIETRGLENYLRMGLKRE